VNGHLNLNYDVLRLYIRPRDVAFGAMHHFENRLIIIVI